MSDHTTKKNSVFKDFVAPVFLVLLIVLLMRWFVIGMYYIPSGSMIPTLSLNDLVVVTKYSYQLNDPERGQIIVFKYPPNERADLEPVDYVKRVIGLPGETLEIKNNQVLINGQAINEPYVAKDTAMPDFGPVVVPENQYFMMGDNRNHSNDSRYWGTVDRRYLVGQARAIYWPIKNWRILS